MGVLNTTPDSFFKGSRRSVPRDAIDQVAWKSKTKERTSWTSAGSRRAHPFRNVLPVSEEIRRVVPVIEALRKRLKIPISIDTIKSEVANAAISAGAEIVNDIGALRFDREYAESHCASKASPSCSCIHVENQSRCTICLEFITSLRTVMESLEWSVEEQFKLGFTKSGSSSIQVSASAKQRRTICCCSNNWPS